MTYTQGEPVTYAAFKTWALAHPSATAGDALRKFPQIGSLQIVAWMGRFGAEMAHRGRS